MSDENKLFPKDEWDSLSINQLYDLKNKFINLYFDLRGSGATFANQYFQFSKDVDELIRKKESSFQ